MKDWLENVSCLEDWERNLRLGDIYLTTSAKGNPHNYNIVKHGNQAWGRGMDGDCKNKANSARLGLAGARAELGNVRNVQIFYSLP